MDQKNFEPNELWKRIDGFGGVYLISNFGRAYVLPCIRHLPSGQQRHHVGKLFNPGNGRGYKNIGLCNPTDPGDRYFKSLHTLVAELFVGGKPSAKHEVNHKDGDKRNCHYTNLEWLTIPQNVKHAFKIGLHKTKTYYFHGNNLTIKEIAKLTGVSRFVMYDRLRNGYSIEDAADKDGKLGKQKKAFKMRSFNKERSLKKSKLRADL
jgi:predicted DNA-binding protein YlxM (UPF0122 family)